METKGLMFPKGSKKKKKRIHKKSILHQRDGTCYLCVRLHQDYSRHKVVHEHHVYGGRNRSISEANGFKVYLCPEHHEFGKEAAHRDNRIMRLMQQDCQREFEKTESREAFMSLIGENYLI